MTLDVESDVRRFEIRYGECSQCGMKGLIADLRGTLIHLTICVECARRIVETLVRAVGRGRNG